MVTETRFLLNDRAVTATAPAGELVLDWLRQRARQTGTKEGCKEGDCGACVVLIGELDGDAVSYKPVTSCLMPVGELAGKHLVTVEGLNLAHSPLRSATSLGDEFTSGAQRRGLNPVQQAIVDEGASQCGFCTPGIVVSMTGMLMVQGARLYREAVKTALSGHLCRCTGYRSLKAAGESVCRSVGERTGVAALVEDGVLPGYFGDVATRLRALREELADATVVLDRSPEPPDFVIAGGTDLYVQKGEDLPDARLDVLDHYPQMKGIERRNGHLRLGALTTFEEFAEHPEAQRIVPEIEDYMFLIASLQIRNRATLGGNVINASPIGDMTVLLLALDAQLVLEELVLEEPVLEEPRATRTVPLREFYKGYKVLDKTAGEVLTEILIPRPEPGTRVGWEKVSKRKCLDIASVNSAIRIRLDGDTVADVRLGVGGVAPIPLELKRTRETLLGRPLDAETVGDALATAQGEISPISDVRGSADYKRLLTHQLLVAHFTRLFPDRLSVVDFEGAS